MSRPSKLNIGQWEFFYKYYSDEGSEGPFTVFKRKNEILPAAESINEEYFSKSIKPKLFAKALKQTPNAGESYKIRMTNFKNHFLLHPFHLNYEDKEPVINQKAFKKYLREYLENQHISIEKLYGYNFKDTKGKDIPYILIKRPINGPLRLLFEKEPDNNLVIGHSFSKIGELTPEKKFILIIGIVSGIDFIHKKSKAFACLNPDTVYLNQKFRPKICCGSFIEPQNIDDDDKEEISELKLLTDVSFAAPEVLSEKHVYQNSDMFSIGMMIYYIINGIEPFQKQSVETKIKNIREGTMPRFPEAFSDEWKEIILKCCEHDPRDRINSTELLNHLLDEKNRNNLVSSMQSSDYKPNFTDNDIQYMTKIKALLNFKSGYQKSEIMNMVEDYDSLDEDVKSIIYYATKNDPNYLETIGILFLKGERGITKDEENALILLKKAADLGCASAAKMVAKLYREGIGTKKDLMAALSYNKKALILFKDDEFEKDILNQRITELENLMEDPKAEKAEIEKLNEFDDDEYDESDNEENNDDSENSAAKAIIKQQSRKIIIEGISSSTTKEDIQRFVSNNYGELRITMNHHAAHDSATVIFQNSKIKLKFCDSLKNRKTIYINNKEVNIKKFIETRVTIRRKQRKYNQRKFISSAIRLTPKSHSTKKKPRAHSVEKKPEPKKRTFKIKLDDYNPGKGNFDYEKVGDGSYSTVYKAYKNDKLYAAKIFNEEFIDYGQKKEFRREIISLSLLNNFPMVVKLIGYNYKSLIDRTVKHATIITEFEPNGTLAKMIKLESKKENPNFWNNTLKIKIIIGIARAMAFIHEKSIIHRDLKPDNIFFDKDFNVKIGDFGSSRKFDNQSEISKTLCVGTPTYAAPEILDDNTPKYNQAADVYSFGIIVYQIVTGQTINQIFPKMKLMTLTKKIVNEGFRPKIPEDIDENLVSLIEQCWSPSIVERPPFNLIYLTFKAIFEYDEPPTTFLPDVEIDEVREYLKEIDSYGE